MDRPALDDDVDAEIDPLAWIIYDELERQEARPRDLGAGDLTEVMVFAPFDLIALVASVRDRL